jgi:hypothetical protein
VVAQKVGVSRRTLTRWLADGWIVRRGLTVTAEPRSPTHRALTWIEDAEPGLVLEGREDGPARNWRAAAWLLERRWPERWAATAKRLVGEHGSPALVEGDPFAEVEGTCCGSW